MTNSHRLFLGLGLVCLIGVGAGVANAANPANGVITTTNTTLHFVATKGSKNVSFDLVTNFLGAGVDVTSATNSTNYTTSILASCSNGANLQRNVTGSSTQMNDNILWCWPAVGNAVQGGLLITN